MGWKWWDTMFVVFIGLVLIGSFVFVALRFP